LQIPALGLNTHKPSGFALKEIHMQSKLFLSILAGALATGAVYAQTAVPKATTTAASTPSAAATTTSTSSTAPSDADRAAWRQQRFAAHFVKLDQNGDGVISREEAAKDARLAQRFDQIDSNKDGNLSKDELHAQQQAMHSWGQRHHHDGKRGARFDARFKAADQDHDGNLSKAEVESAAAKWFEQRDANHDGKLTPDEIRAGMMQRHKRG
jgi:Ca2+-binding EF-hand superfamily protein